MRAIIFFVFLVNTLVEGVRHSQNVADGSNGRPFDLEKLTKNAHWRDWQKVKEKMGIDGAKSEISDDKRQQMLGHRSCLNLLMGFDFLRQSMTKIVQQYLDIYNDRWPGRRDQTHEPKLYEGIGKLQEQLILTSKEKYGGTLHQWNTKHNSQFGRGVHFPDGIKFELKNKAGTFNHGYLKGSTINLVEGTDGEQILQLTVPIVGSSIETDVDISFETDVVLELVNGPQLELRQKKQSVIKNLNCQHKDTNFCNFVHNDLINTLAVKLMPIDDKWYWDQVSAYRTMKGLIDSANHHKANYADSSLFNFDGSSQNMQIFFNCQDESIERVLNSEPVPSSSFQIGVAQNFFEFLFPKENIVHIQDFIEEMRTIDDQNREFVTRLGLNQAQGGFRIVSDPDILSQLDLDKIHKPGLNRQEDVEWDDNHIKKMDKYEWNHVMFLQFYGGSKADETLIMPIEITVNWLSAFRQGIGSIHGPTQEYARRWLWPFRVEAKECQSVKAENQVRQPAHLDPTTVICDPRFLKAFNEVQLRRSNLYQERVWDLFSSARDNIWFTFERLEYPFNFLCAGVDIRNPLLRFEQGQMFMSVATTDDPLNIDQYCDNMWQEMIDVHPFSMLRDKGTFNRLSESFEKLNDKKWNQEFFFAAPLMGRRSFWHDQTWWPDRVLDLQLASPFLHFFSTHLKYQEWCAEMHPDWDTYKCGMIYMYHKKHDDFDRIMDFNRSFFGYYDDIEQSWLLWAIRDYSKYLLYVGLLLHLLQIRLPGWFMISLMCAFNFLTYLPSLYMPFKRFGPDYTAYINQAGQFASGTTDYKHISSVQGQCFYPAGHLFHYVPIYYMYLFTDKAEHVVKILHYLMHTGTIYCVAKMAQKYFRANPMSFQIVCFMLISNQEVREMNMELFNDSFTVLYVAIAMYYMINNGNPIWASFWFTMALSVKAGAMLLVPAFLGWIQYQHGLRNLLASIFVIVSFQILIASPFCFDPVAKLLGFSGGDTSWKDYLKYAKFAGGDKDRQYGSLYDWTIYWQMIDRRIYYKWWFVVILKMTMLLINVWYFFIRRFCLMDAVYNALTFFEPKWALGVRQRLPYWKQRKGLEIMIICYIAGAQFVPGGHQQFQMWYWDLIPIAIEMVGLPSAFTFKLYHDIYPSRIVHPTIHHFFALILSFWLITVGPYMFGLLFPKSSKLHEEKKNESKKVKDE